MLHVDAHPHLAAIVARGVLASPPGDAERAAVEAGALGGCTRCARALVNAADTGAALALALDAGTTRAPGAALRERVLRGVATRRGPRGARAEAPTTRAPFDPSASVAFHHASGPHEVARTREVDALCALDPAPGEPTGRYLAELAALIDFPILFVSVVRGDRVGYRVQRGLDPALAELREIRREMSYCTHTVDADAPFVVENAAAEPFFRGSRMVRRFHIEAYAGAPIRSSRGVVIGTVCALDHAPRAIPLEVTAMLALYTEPVRAVIERPRDLPFGEAAWVHAEEWFRRLLAVAHADARRRGAPSTLIAGPPGAARALASLSCEGEVVGQLGDGALGLLVAGAAPAVIAARAQEIRAALAGRGLGECAVRVASSAEVSDAEAWARAAR